MRIKKQAFLAGLAVIGLSACSTYDPYGPYDRGYGQGYDPYDRGYGYDNGRGRFGQYAYIGSDFQPGRWDPQHNYFRGSGASILDPWLASTPLGRDVVFYRFDRDYDGEISVDNAERVNAWFRAYADVNRDYRLTDREIGDALNRAVRERPRYW